MSGEFSSSFDKIERFYPPPPPFGVYPGVESVTIETPRQPIVPLRQGDEERSDGGVDKIVLVVSG